MIDPKVIGLSGFGMEVPDLGDAERFYDTFGLDARGRNGALRLGSTGRFCRATPMVEVSESTCIRGGNWKELGRRCVSDTC